MVRTSGSRVWFPLIVALGMASGAAAVPAGLATAGAAAAAAAPPAGAKAGAWSEADIGAPEKAGDHTYERGALSVTGAGTGPSWDTKDQLHYVFQPYAQGDVEIIARLASFTGGPKAQAGIMLRRSNAPDAAVASITFNPEAWQAEDGKSYARVGAWGRDAAAPGTSQQSNGNTATPLVPPLWLRIAGVGRDYAVYKSSDGKAWAQVHNDSGGAFTPAGAINLGFFVSSGDAAKTVTAVFDNIHIGKPRLGY